MRKYFHILLVSIFLFSIGGCSKNSSDGGNSTTKTPRMVIVYLGGDNNLSFETNEKIDAIREGWAPGKGELLIYQDTYNGTPKLLRMRGADKTHSRNYTEVIETYEEENSASPEVLNRVIRKVIQDYPSDSYGLLIFSHGSGWLPDLTLSFPEGTKTARSIIIDNSTSSPNGEAMNIEDFASAIPDKSMDFIIFEACLMSGVEVAYELKEKTDYILASSAEILSPGFTDIYPSSIMLLFDTNISPQENLQNFAENYYNTVNNFSDVFRSATLSIIQTSELDELAALTKEAIANDRSDITAYRDDLQRFDRPGEYNENPIIYQSRFFDYEDYMQHIANTDLYNAIEAQLSKTVVWKAATPQFMMPANNSSFNYNGFKIERHCGLTTYIEQPELSYLNEQYEQTAWYKATRF